MIITTIVAIVVGFVGAVTIFKQSQEKQRGFLAAENAEVFVRDYSPVYGNEDAQVYVTEFLDPECESCRAFYPYVKELLASYGGKVKLVVRYVPYHGNSKLVIKILEAARKQNKYWETLELLFNYQPHWGNHHNPRPDLIWTFLQELDLDIDKLKKDMQDPAIDKIIAQDSADAETLNVRGTPTFFVNGKEPSNFGMQYLKELIDEELGK